MKKVEELAIKAMLDQSVEAVFGDNAAVVLDMINASEYPEAQKLKVIGIEIDPSKVFPFADKIQSVCWITGVITTIGGEEILISAWDAKMSVKQPTPKSQTKVETDLVEKESSIDFRSNTLGKGGFQQVKKPAKQNTEQLAILEMNRRGKDQDVEE